MPAVVTGRASQAGQVSDEKLDKEVTQNIVLPCTENMVIQRLREGYSDINLRDRPGSEAVVKATGLGDGNLKIKDLVLQVGGSS